MGIKNGIILAVARHGTVKRPRDITVEVNADEHSIIHILYSLHRQNILTFREKKRGTVQEPVRIRLTPHGESEARRLQR